MLHHIAAAAAVREHLHRANLRRTQASSSGSRWSIKKSGSGTTVAPKLCAHSPRGNAKAVASRSSQLNFDGFVSYVVMRARTGAHQLRIQVIWHFMLGSYSSRTDHRAYLAVLIQTARSTCVSSTPVSSCFKQQRINCSVSSVKEVTM